METTVEVRDPKFMVREPRFRPFNPVLSDEEAKVILERLGIKFEQSANGYKRRPGKDFPRR